jgi:ubiquinone/menaquinone biosynthesis C-methylase UbiE
MDIAQPEYVFHQGEDQLELERLRAIEQVFDPSSRRRLLATGLKAGWSCLEVGPGAGSILDWLSDVVGRSGGLCAVDLSTKFIPMRRPAHVIVQQGDVRTMLLLDSSFDLIHARYVLIHLPDYAAALSKMLACLKPGGWAGSRRTGFLRFARHYRRCGAACGGQQREPRHQSHVR